MKLALSISHFSDEETEAQEVNRLPQGHTAGWWRSRDVLSAKLYALWPSTNPWIWTCLKSSRSITQCELTRLLYHTVGTKICHWNDRIVMSSDERRRNCRHTLSQPCHSDRAGSIRGPELSQCSCNTHDEELGEVRTNTVSSTLWSVGAGVGTRGLCQPGKVSYRGFTPNIPLGWLEILSVTLGGGQTCRICLASQPWCTLPPEGE